MNARDNLVALAGQDMPVTYEEVNTAIDAYAHELAEKIREWERNAETLLPIERATARGVANIIDPKNMTPREAADELSRDRIGYE